MSTTHHRTSEIRAALATCRSALLATAATSGLVNVLYLTGSFFMLQVYDRVLPGRSIPTLVGISILALGLFLFQGAFEALRGRILVRIGNAMDEILSERIYRGVLDARLKGRAGDGQQPLRDFDQIRNALSGPALVTVFDLPWLPIYVFVCFLFHPLIGIAALAGTVVLVALTLVMDRLAGSASKATAEASRRRFEQLAAAQRNAEVVHVMGMAARLHARWAKENTAYRQHATSASDVGTGFGAASKVFRSVFQSGVLALGAVLVIDGQASAGIIIAGSILTARALAPVDHAIAHWRTLTAARLSWARLEQALRAAPEPAAPRLRLDPPARRIVVEQLAGGPPEARRVTFGDVAFGLDAGTAMGIIGPSASGKSSLARTLIGAWPALRGSIRLDGAPLDRWDPEMLGRHLGYLPQTVELLRGSVADNICRFDPDRDPAMVVAAARSAGVHELILRLPEGYETDIGEDGAALSAGQRQRIALARALYGDPFLVVLDEPNSNLDAEGEEALTEAILKVRARGGIVVVVAHRPSALAAVDHVLVMKDGRQQAFGPKNEILSSILRRPGMPIAPVELISTSAQWKVAADA